ncbi:hypothetical protein DNAM_130 [Pseudomonas phage BroderSalsa]|nr:hypothetical protein DNAM_130 [Pseudomonas phage BroderSalsa]
MAEKFIGRSKTFALTDEPTMIASRNPHRKGIFIANHDALPAYIAVGLSPSAEDFFQLGETQEVIFDIIKPLGPVWARGSGRLTVIDSMDTATPFDPATLFTPGRQGFWLDIHDLSTLFEDEEGTIPATVDGPVRLIKDKSGNGHDFKVFRDWKPAILRRREYHTYLEFDTENGYTCDEKFSWFSDPYESVNGGIMAAAIVPNGAPDKWSPILGNNGGSGNNIGFYISQERRIAHSRIQGAFRSYINSNSALSAEGTLPAGQPAVVSAISARAPDNKITQRLDVNGRFLISENNTRRFPQPAISTVAIGVSSANYSVGSASYKGELHGVMCVSAVTTDEKNKIHLYLGADVGAPVHGV